MINVDLSSAFAVRCRVGKGDVLLYKVIHFWPTNSPFSLRRILRQYTQVLKGRAYTDFFFKFDIGYTEDFSQGVMVSCNGFFF